ncbi:hypothetical protein [Nocardia cyriacigeorgica]|uniref:hypothetical protein n=1 Tax=Nocardia cyriacigeorgica TaxID=135487 RepID=UPI001894E9DB|nr:hypothetical protein [Nocardia cyriacigeorgica]MBF6163008.1 hypothetical protein [Nocardia cyriacigeorgica]MBF6201987.1 hypothetical protein [Nocardia cyriacigeorgica]
MNPHVDRKPAIGPRPHPADHIPDKPATPPPAPAPAATPQRPATEERLIEQHNVRIRPSTKDRLGRAVDKLRYETGDRSISIASLTDQALREFLDRNGC